MIADGLGARRSISARSFAARARLATRGGIAIGLLLPCFVGAQDTLSLPDLEALPGTVRAVPVFVRDVSGTTLDEGEGSGLEIQGFSFRVFFAPPGSVTASTFLQAGVTAGKSAFFSSISPGTDDLSVILGFLASTNPLAFTLDAAAPGNVVGELRLTLSPSATLGSTIALTLDDSGNAALSNDPGSLSETLANGQLALGNGSIFLDGDVFVDGFENGNRCAWSASVPADSC